MSDKIAWMRHGASGRTPARSPAQDTAAQAVRVVASASAAALIRERGGRLYVWVRRGRCCGSGMLTLSTAREPPAGIEFDAVTTEADFELFLPTRLARLPDELQLELRRWPRCIEAYWDGCAWVV